MALALLAGLGLLPACADDGGGDGDEAGTTDGDTGDSGDTGDTDGGEVPALYGVPNLDDDDQNGKADWTEPPSAADNDLSEWSLPPAVVAAAGEGGSVEIGLSGDANDVRFWLDGSPLLGNVGTADSAAASSRCPATTCGSRTSSSGPRPPPRASASTSPWTRSATGPSTPTSRA
ncbi:MAG: hypothetical protein KC457_05005 [Myxococcales bacterium]|nr:hypothetical protein [Myxococcales bacterium]